MRLKSSWIPSSSSNCRKEVTIKTDDAESDTPLLLSRSAMKRAGIKMDLENDSATIIGKDIALNLNIRVLLYPNW